VRYKVTVGEELGLYLCLCCIELYDLSRLSHLVLDEADTLLDDSFSQLTLRIIRKLKVSYILLQETHQEMILPYTLCSILLIFHPQWPDGATVVAFDRSTIALFCYPSCV